MEKMRCESLNSIKTKQTQQKLRRNKLRIRTLNANKNMKKDKKKFKKKMFHETKWENI